MNMRNLFLTLAFGLCSGVFAQNTTVFESPIMGWSSWNTYRVHINDTLIIRGQRIFLVGKLSFKRIA